MSKTTIVIEHSDCCTTTNQEPQEKKNIIVPFGCNIVFRSEQNKDLDDNVPPTAGDHIMYMGENNELTSELVQ